jgi:hypothetical protein
MRRITVEEIREAYQRTGLKPVRRTWRAWNNQTMQLECCCAMTALASCDGVDAHQSSTGAIIDWGDRKFGSLYCFSFREGFDGFAAASFHSKEGYEDGRAVAAAIFGEATP